MQPSKRKIIGPFDQRHRTTRCQPCVKRHVKCSGGIPCANCVQTNRDCSQNTSHAHKYILFVDQSERFPARTATSSSPTPDLSIHVLQHKQSNYLTYFFSTFLAINDLSGGFDAQPALLLDLASRSSALRQCFVALSALHISRPNSTARDQSQVTTRYDAIAAYQHSVVLLLAHLARPNQAADDIAPWTTFFLGIFELMFEVSGERWASHMREGTSRLLSLREPHDFLGGSNRNFYLTMRIYEVTRALSFYDTTFLDQIAWKQLQKDLWAGGEKRNKWHPIESLFELMISVSGLLSRVLKFVATQPEAVGQDLESAIELGVNGCVIQSQISHWNCDMESWIQLSSPFPDLDWATHCDSRALVGKIYYHTMVIYLSAMFGTQRQIWRSHAVRDYVPTCPSDAVNSHVQAILDLIELALDHSNVVGLLFYLPIRVAGQRCARGDDRARILSIVSRIAERGFLVIKSLHPVFERLWGRDRAG